MSFNVKSLHIVSLKRLKYTFTLTLTLNIVFVVNKNKEKPLHFLIDEKKYLYVK